MKFSAGLNFSLGIFVWRAIADLAGPNCGRAKAPSPTGA